MLRKAKMRDGLDWQQRPIKQSFFTKAMAQFLAA
jgi:hypothetical protein